MKRISFLLVACSLWLAPAVRGQDAATQERLDKLSGKIEDLIAAQESLKKQMLELSREVESVREHSSKPQPTYASHDDLKRVADAVTEESQNRIKDYDKIRAELKSLGKVITAPAPAPKKSTTSTAPPAAERDKPAEPKGDQKGFEYKVKSGDTLSTILQAYREQTPPIKVKLDDVLKANPGLKPEKLKVGQTIFIPEPKS